MIIAHKMVVDIRSAESCYITIGKHKVYLEISRATEDKPHVSYWKEDWEDDRVITLNG